MGTGTRVERQQNAFCQAFPVRFLLIGTLLPSDTTKFSPSMNAMMGLRTELLFHRATLDGMRRFSSSAVICIFHAIRYSEIFADYGCHNGFENRITFPQGRDDRRRFCLSAVSGITNKVKQQ